MESNAAAKSQAYATFEDYDSGIQIVEPSEPVRNGSRHAVADSNVDLVIVENSTRGSSEDDGKVQPLVAGKGGLRRPVLNGPQRRCYFPVTLVTVLLACIAGFVFELYKGNWEFVSLSENPMLGPSPQAMIDSGAKYDPLLRDGEWWRVLVPMILHAGVFHFVINMLAWLKLAKDLEPLYGWWRLFIIFVCSGFLGTLASAVFLPTVITVGASSSIFGMFGASWVEFFENYPRAAAGWCCQFILLIVGTVINLAIGLLPFIDNFAHLGGFIGGICIGQLLIISTNPPPHLLPYPRSQMKKSFGCRLFAAAVCTIIFLILAGIGVYIVFFSDVDMSDWCPGCREINCLSALFNCENQ